MKQNWKYKLIATVFTAVVLFPFFVQAAHAFETHEHTICTAKFEKHYHEDEIDCSICHFQIKHETFDFSADYSLENFKENKSKNFKVLQVDYVYYSTHKSTRAPPHLV